MNVGMQCWEAHVRGAHPDSSIHVGQAYLARPFLPPLANQAAAVGQFLEEPNSDAQKGQLPGSGSSMRSAAPGGAKYVTTTSAGCPVSSRAMWALSPVSRNA